MAELHLSYSRSVVVEAPIGHLHAQLRSVDSLTRFMPNVALAEPTSSAADGDAACLATLHVGHRCHRISATVHVEHTEDPRLVRARVGVPGLGIELVAVFELTPRSRRETYLSYQASLTTDHPRLRRRRRSLGATLEEHVATTSALVARLVPQHLRASRALGTVRMSL